MPANAVSAPTASTRMRMAESVETVPATTRSPTSLEHGPGLPGDHRLVQFGFAVDDDTVGGNATTGTHEHHVTDAQIMDRHRFDAMLGDSFGFVGKQLRERRECALGLTDGPHLEPMAEQHDRHQRGELEPQVDVDPPELGRDRRAERDEQPHRDEQHHPRLS